MLEKYPGLKIALIVLGSILLAPVFILYYTYKITFK